MNWSEEWTNLIWRVTSVDVFILFEILYVVESVIAYNMEWAVMCYMGLVYFNFGLSIYWKNWNSKFSSAGQKMASLHVLGSCPKQAQKTSFGTSASLGYSLFCNESNHHKRIATSPPSHGHVSRGYFFVSFFCPTWHLIASHGTNFVTFLGFISDKKRGSQFSDTARIVTKFVTKKQFSSQNTFYDPH